VVNYGKLPVIYHGYKLPVSYRSGNLPGAHNTNRLCDNVFC